MVIYSHSRLSTFEQCPLKFKYRYIDKIIPEIEVSIEAVLGKAVHGALEWLYTEIIKKLGRVPTLHEIIDEYTERWNNEYKENATLFQGEKNQGFYFNKGVQYLIDYYNKHYPFEDGTLECEKKITIDLDGTGKYLMQGFIDRISHLPEKNEIIIHDYKTSGFLPSKDKFENDRQLALYAIAIKEIFGNEKRICLTWHYLAHNVKICSFRNSEQLEALKKETIELINKIEATKEFPGKKSNFCNWCEYKNLCEKFK